MVRLQPRASYYQPTKWQPLLSWRKMTRLAIARRCSRLMSPSLVILLMSDTQPVSTGRCPLDACCVAPVYMATSDQSARAFQTKARARKSLGSLYKVPGDA